MINPAHAPRLSIVLPAYNEQDALRDAIERYLAGLEACGIESFELLVVDDGSTDATGRLADELAGSDPRIRVVHQERNLGQAAAILTGFRHARGAIVTHNGIDLPFAPRDTARAMAPFGEGADVVVVERATRGSYGLARRVISRANVLLVRLLFRSPFRDHNFVQFYRREVVESIQPRSRGVSTVTPELILRARRRGYRVVAVPADYHRRRRGASSIGVREVLHAAVETLRLRWLMRLPDGPAVEPRGHAESQIPDSTFHTPESGSPSRPGGSPRSPGASGSTRE